MNLVRWSTIAAFIVVAGCSGGGGDSTGPGTGGNGGNGGGGGGGGGTCPAGAICFGSSQYSPRSITVNVGATVPFINDSGIGHTVNFDSPRPPLVEDIGLHTSGTNNRTFSQAGTFNFHCTQHVGMTGSIVVQ